jgi:hypothetical protein
MSAELNGYEDTGEPPTYRILHGQPMVHTPFRGLEILHYQIADERIVEIYVNAHNLPHSAGRTICT